MRNQPVKPPAQHRTDWKGTGYLVSIVSVLFLGSIAWPGPDEPEWHILALVIGVATSIIGMACRYKSHLDDQRKIKQATAEARRS
ncbi:MAG TPA: hypothetical protein VM145_00430 [Sphingomicrobium sp.]|nr:hypothetical protein [Sphingomicrobium sp.]